MRTRTLQIEKGEELEEDVLCQYILPLLWADTYVSLISYVGVGVLKAGLFEGESGPFNPPRL